jgi:hypothetical protein
MINASFNPSSLTLMPKEIKKTDSPTKPWMRRGPAFSWRMKWKNLWQTESFMKLVCCHNGLMHYAEMLR